CHCYDVLERSGEEVVSHRFERDCVAEQVDRVIELLLVPPPNRQAALAHSARDGLCDNRLARAGYAVDKNEPCALGPKSCQLGVQVVDRHHVWLSIRWLEYAHDEFEVVIAHVVSLAGLSIAQPSASRHLR